MTATRLAPAPKRTPPAPAAPAGSGGQALDRHTNAAMSARFGHDFSQVRIHTDARASESAQAMGARAFALGPDIVFGPGQWTPGSPQTDRLLAHELTHVVQQAQWGGPGDWGRASRKSDASEREAESLASQVMMGRTVDVQAAPGAAIARVGEDDLCSADPSTEVCAAPPASGPNRSVAPPPPMVSGPVSTPPDPDRVAAPGAGPAAPFYSTYPQAAYGIMNSCAAPADTAHALVHAAQRDLGARGVPDYPVGQLEADDPSSGVAVVGPQDWEFDVHSRDFNTERGGQARPVEDLADAANTVAHEGFHMYQGYEEARLTAGLGGDPSSVVPPAVAAQAARDPILRSDAHTARVQEWYENDHGAGRADSQRIEADPGAHLHEYCQLPVERDAWNAGGAVTTDFRQAAGAPTPARADDQALCE